MSRTVLFAGGPMHGKTLPVEDHLRTVCVAVPPEPFARDGEPAPPFLRQVAYGLFKFVLCGRLIWIGYSGTEPDEDLVFEVLVSDGAKAAASRIPVPAT